MSESIVLTHHLTRHFGDLIAVDHVTLSVRIGEIFGLLGPNGAGKSTFIKMLTTLLVPTSGSGQVGGYDIVRQATAVRRVIGYVPQSLSVDGDLTAYENLLVFSRLYDIPRSERRKRIEEALSIMGLSGSANALVKSYSGGMIRRLEIAQSTMHRPKVLFLDEPTVGLDPVARHTVWELVKQLQRLYGSTILLTTHYMDEAERLCERMALLNSGKMVAIGTADELKSRLGADATLDDVFEHYSKQRLDREGHYEEISRTRRAARRLS